jgi:hypothetical protein
MDLYLPPIFKQKRSRPKIIWSSEMLSQLTKLFPVSYNIDLSKQLGVSPRTLIRKARELNINKELGFLEKRRDEITIMAVKAHPPHPHKGELGWCIPNGESHRFKEGNISVMAVNPDIVEKVRMKRNATIRRERIRIRIGLSRLTKLNLK